MNIFYLIRIVYKLFVICFFFILKMPQLDFYVWFSQLLIVFFFFILSYLFFFLFFLPKFVRVFFVRKNFLNKFKKMSFRLDIEKRLVNNGFFLDYFVESLNYKVFYLLKLKKIFFFDYQKEQINALLSILLEDELNIFFSGRFNEFLMLDLNAYFLFKKFMVLLVYRIFNKKVFLFLLNRIINIKIRTFYSIKQKNFFILEPLQKNKKKYFFKNNKLFKID